MLSKLDTSLDSDAARASFVKLPNTAAPESIWDQAGAIKSVIKVKQSVRKTLSSITRATVSSRRRMGKGPKKFCLCELRMSIVQGYQRKRGLTIT